VDFEERVSADGYDQRFLRNLLEVITDEERVLRIRLFKFYFWWF